MLNDLWYKNAIVYCLSVGTYLDANGDGIGDFEGLIRRLDYLQGLGITTLWLMPFQPSPCRDNGYDVSDYYNVDPRYGTLGDFADFRKRATTLRRSIATGTSGRKRDRLMRRKASFFPAFKSRPGPTINRPPFGTSIASTRFSPI